MRLPFRPLYLAPLQPQKKVEPLRRVLRALFAVVVGALFWRVRVPPVRVGALVHRLPPRPVLAHRVTQRLVRVRGVVVFVRVPAPPLPFFLLAAIPHRVFPFKPFPPLLIQHVPNPYTLTHITPLHLRRTFPRCHNTYPLTPKVRRITNAGCIPSDF